MEFINLTPENLANEHLCCIIRSKKPHAGVEAKREWLAQRLCEGHVFRKLDVKGAVFIEYAPLDKAWTPITGADYLYIYCLWVNTLKGEGYGRQLMEYCIEDARAQGRSGVCMLGAKKQKAWLSDQQFAKRFGFKTVDETAGGFELLALSFDGSAPAFTPAARAEAIESEALTVYYSPQCPYTVQALASVREVCAEKGVPCDIICVDKLEKAKALPCAFNNFALFYRGKLQTINLPDAAALRRILR